MSKRQIHIELIIEVADDDSFEDAYLNTEDSAVWIMGHTYDIDNEDWVEDDFDLLDTSTGIANLIIQKGKAAL